MKIIILNTTPFKGLASQILEKLDSLGVEVELIDETTTFSGNIRSPLTILHEKVEKSDLVIFLATSESMALPTFEYITDLAERGNKLYVYTLLFGSSNIPRWFLERHKVLITNFEALYLSLK